MQTISFQVQTLLLKRRKVIFNISAKNVQVIHLAIKFSRNYKMSVGKWQGP